MATSFCASTAHSKASGARNFTQCDSLLIGKTCAAHTVPYVESDTAKAQFEHEATTTRLSEDQLFYAMQRGLSQEEAVALLVNGFVRQDSNTRHLIHNIWAQISYLSTAFTLEPGDILATGTPEGVGIAMDPPCFLQPGDVVRCEIDGIGFIENKVAGR